jgi:hypothetical protein
MSEKADQTNGACVSSVFCECEENADTGRSGGVTSIVVNPSELLRG